MGDEVGDSLDPEHKEQGNERGTWAFHQEPQEP